MTAPYTAGEIRDFLRENVTVVAPGEWLILRCRDLTPAQMTEWQEVLSRQSEAEDGLPFRVLVVHADELGVASGDGIRESVRTVVRDELDRRSRPTGHAIRALCRDMGIDPGEPMTDEDLAEFRRRLDDTLSPERAGRLTSGSWLPPERESSWLDDCEFGTGDPAVRVTHKSTGVSFEAVSRAGAVALMATWLVQHGRISLNAARAALGETAWPERLAAEADLSLWLARRGVMSPAEAGLPVDDNGSVITP